MRRAIFNKKGGVGKTTITCNLAAVSALNGKKTLVIDLDPQANASQYLLGGEFSESQETGKTAYEFFKAGIDNNSYSFGNPFLPSVSKKSPGLEEYVHETEFENLHVVPAHPLLTEIETQLVNKHKIYKLREALDQMNTYEAVYIDTPPALNFFSLSALIAASSCLIPFDCDAFSKDAIYDVGKHIVDIQRDHNSALSIEGIVVNQFMPRARHPREIVDDLKADGLPILNTHLSSSVKIRESHQNAAPLIFMEPKHKLSQEFDQLYREIHSS